MFLQGNNCPDCFSTLAEHVLPLTILQSKANIDWKPKQGVHKLNAKEIFSINDV